MLAAGCWLQRCMDSSVHFLFLSWAMLCLRHQCLAVATITFAFLLLSCQDLMNSGHLDRQLLVDLVQHFALKLLKKLRCRLSQWHTRYLSELSAHQCNHAHRRGGLSSKRLDCAMLPEKSLFWRTELIRTRSTCICTNLLIRNTNAWHEPTWSHWRLLGSWHPAPSF